MVFGATALSLLGAGSALIHHYTGGPFIGTGHEIAIARAPAPATAEPHRVSGRAAAKLFLRDGKEDRADYVAALEPLETSARGGDVQFVAASLTPLEMTQLGAIPKAPAAIPHQDVNRGGKADRLQMPQMTVAKLISDDEPAAAGTSAALFMIAPSAALGQDAAPEPAALVSGPVRAAHGSQTGAPGQTPWKDLVKLARLDGGDGEDIKATIFGGLTEKEFRAREFRCMASAIYFEARGEAVKGQIAVGQVIMTRVNSDYYPNTICGVVFQGQWNKNACQFSFACDGVPDTPKDKKQWETALDVARKVISGQVYLDEVGDATHYHATYVSPPWRKLVNKITRIGVHIFYKAPFVQPLVASNDFEKL
jgi:hypothetical protein